MNRHRRTPEAGSSGGLTPIAIAGGSGFVGSSLRAALGDRYRWVCLTRSEARVAAATQRDEDGTQWRHCDLFSLPQVREALKGCRYAVYLVHSMMPSSRLTQGKFADLDLLMADNFARAAEDAGVEHIVYLAGLLPDIRRRLSPHLRSRLEVERILQIRTTPVTVLRAGLIFGPGGSSARMLIQLVRRLPVMVLPKWTGSVTQSIDIDDVVRAIEHVIGNPETYGRVFDLAGHPPMSYAEMIRRTARILDYKRLLVQSPINLFWLSRGWIALFSGVSRHLVNPLLESLKHDLVAAPNPLMDWLESDAVPFEESVRKSVDNRDRPVPNPRSMTQLEDNSLIRQASRVRSVQRMPMPPGWNAVRTAEAYAEWLTRVSGTLVRVTIEPGGVIAFRWRVPGILLLELTASEITKTPDRKVFHITGGALARKDMEPAGRLEFRVIPQGPWIMTAVHSYVPRLPWRVYEWTQAKIHLFVMLAFRRYLRRQTERITRNERERLTTWK